ncbi:MAG: ATP-dependent DNA helicase [Betaproteobacteria bacterium]|nr:ATP-dependent DNA helicase [Betaproteobacteria bacterium]
MHDLDAIFSESGPLARAVPGYRLRAQQVEMARAIGEAMERHGMLVAEAGTGTGKTFAYLVPALTCGGKAIISTGTKTLQDQLFNRDIPSVREALKAPVTVALLKGRANYVCHYHLDRAAKDGRFAAREDAGYLHLIERYTAVSKTGDRAGLAEVPENAGVWPMVTSTRENCLGSGCPYYKDCFVMKARQQALEAEVVVVNHHLFFADVMLRDEGVAELLPACNTVIFDEAHQLPDTASLFFGESVSTAQLLDLARDTRMEAMVSAKDFAPLPDAASALDKAARDLRLAFRNGVARHTLAALRRDERFGVALAAVLERLENLASLLEFQAERSDGLAHCWGRSAGLKDRLERWKACDADDGYVRWVEVFGHSVQFNATPLSVADIFRKQLEGHPRTWVFTSATLAVKGDFSHYCREMGLEAAATVCWESPFDYGNQGLLYVPEGLPEPNTPEFTSAVVRAALPVLRASRGRAFLLFTSLRAMEQAYGLLRDAFAEEGLDHPLLLQGQGPRSDMLNRFRDLGDAVLVGSHSFWEGVDVRGEALSLVVIDRLPFSPPDDPVLAARIDALNRAGRNAFMEYQLPEAVITLKQGAGRLIRDETDRGVLMICDPRIVTKAYGKLIWRSLPPMRRTRSLEEVESFFNTAGNAAAAAE